MELRPGQLIGKNVRLVRLLGEGGMGSVWVADHLTLQTEVAVKFILGDLVKDPQALRRFTSEATASAQIKSPHVVQVFDHGVWNELPYIVMELLVGEDLEGKIVRGGPVALADTALIIKQCARALSQAHTLGIVHRDIKPANVFITSPDGEIFVKLLDFGIAKRLQGDNHAKTATGALIGTPYYMSPEQVMDDREIDFRADLWALSVVAYECLTTRLPFDGASLGAICVAINACMYRPVTELNPTLPREIDRWFAKAFARRPEERFGSVKELADALVAIAHGSGHYSWDSMTSRSGRISQLPSSPSYPTPPPALPSHPPVLPPPPPGQPASTLPGGAAAPARSPTPGSMPAQSPQGAASHTPIGAVSAVLPPPAAPPGRAATPLPGAVPAVSAAIPLSAAARSTTPLSDIMPAPGPWPAAPPPAPSNSGLPGTSSVLPIPRAGSRTDPLPPANLVPIEPYPKQTLSGTTMSDGSTTRRKRRLAVAALGGVAATGVIVALIVVLTRSPAATTDADHPGDSVHGGEPTPNIPATVPAPTVAPADGTVVPAIPEAPPDSSAVPTGEPTGPDTTSKPDSSAAPGSPTGKSSTTPKTAPTRPRRRDHGF
jgi:eukaryotic-like serine/threonine-protein kinase